MLLDGAPDAEGGRPGSRRRGGGPGGAAAEGLCPGYALEEKALFTGDLILGGSTTVIPPDDGNLGDYMASLRKLQSLEVRRIYPAHGPVIEDGPAKIQEYIDHRLMRERQILEALGAGLCTIPEMVRGSTPMYLPPSTARPPCRSSPTC